MVGDDAKFGISNRKSVDCLFDDSNKDTLKIIHPRYKSRQYNWHETINKSR